MKLGYSPVSIFAQLCGSAAATAAVSFSPATAGVAAGIGTFVNAIFGGIEIKGEGNNIRADLTHAMDAAWGTIQKKYDLTEGCMAELKMEIMGERTSVAEFVRNSQSVGLKYAVTDVIESIFQRHTEDLNKNTRYVWSRGFTRKASSEISAILIGAIEDVFESNDSLRILKAIADSDARRREEYRGISDRLGEINSKVDQFFDTQTMVSVSAPKDRQVLPTIREKILTPCEPFIEGIHRMEDLSNIHTLLTRTNKPLWLYGERGIGKTELIRKFASQHSEYEFIFTTYSGSINQTISKNLFFFREYELNGMELKDMVRYQKNKAAFSEYSRQLKEESRNIVLIIDNYYPYDYEEKCREEMEIDIHSGISGEKNDITEIKELLKTGVKVILMGQNKPRGSDIYASYEIRGLDEDDHFAVMTGCFTKIVPYLEKEGVRERLLYLIRAADKRTVFVTIMALAMQNSELKPEEALDKMTKSFDVGGVYDFRYSLKALKMHDHMEKILGFIGFSYPEKQVLAVLAMLPAQGMEYGLFKQLMTSNSVQLDRIRQAALQKFIDTGIIIEEHQQTESGENRMIRMSPLVADHALRIITGDDSKSLLNSIRMNWISRLLHYIDEDELKGLKIHDRKYQQIPMLAEACLASEQKLRSFGERFRCEEDVAVTRRNLLMTASRLSDKTGNVKDALEYVERAIAVEGPYSEDMNSLVYRINSVGLLFLNAGKYNRAKNCFLNCLKILNDINYIIPNEVEKGFNSYEVESILQTDDVVEYAMLFNNLALLYNIKDDYGKAQEYCEKALAIHEHVFGINHPNTATTYNNMAGVYKAQGDYEKALEYYGKALAIRERVLGPGHPDTATTYNNMAAVYDAQGDYGKAIEYYRKAIAVGVNVLGEDHPNTASMYHNIAGVYYIQGDYDKALEYYGKAIAIRERMLGTDHPDTASTYSIIAGTYYTQGDYAKALEYCRKATSIFLSTFGENHPRTRDMLQKTSFMQLLVDTGMTEDELIEMLKTQKPD